MINSLQSLRGIFAVLIFLHHIIYNGKNLFLAGGSSGVCFFFILSGFVMCAGWEKKLDKDSISKKDLFIRRIIRLYPLHLLCLMVFILLNLRHLLTYPTHIFKLIPNLLLLQSWIPIESIYFSGNMLSWCLCDLMFFYGLFPYIITFIEHYKRLFFYFIILSISAYLVGITFLPNRYWHPLIYINPLFRVLDFLIGISLWQLYLIIRTNRKLISTINSKEGYTNCIEILTIAIFVMFMLMFHIIPKNFRYDAYWWLPSSLLIIIFTVFNNKGMFGKILNNVFLVKFGDVSFSFYMVHIILLTFLDKIYRIVFGEYNVLFSILPSFFIITFVAFIIHRYYETPIANCFIRVLKKK